MLSQLGETGSSFLYLLLCLFLNRTWWPISFISSIVLSQDSLSTTTNLLILALSSSLITLFYRWTSIIFLAHGHLTTIDSIFTIKHICAVHVHLGGVDVLNHITPQFLVVGSHCQTVRKIRGVVHFFTVIVVNFLLDLVYLALNVTKTPLLWLLHLDHHLLNLFELLEAICLHFFKLLLFLDKHVETCLFVVAKEGMLDFITNLQAIFSLLAESFIKLICLFGCWRRWWNCKALLLHASSL